MTFETGSMAEVDFERNVTSLYEAISKSDWEKASKVCRRNPIEAKTWVVRREPEMRESADGESKILWSFLPLHSACARRPPSSFVIDLLDAYPDAAGLKDEAGMYAIHYACGNRASKSVITELVKCYPRALQEADPHGMLPLHYIAQWGPSEDGIVELLMVFYAEGTLALNSEGMSPLDLCREANYDDWEKVLTLMKDKVAVLHIKRMETGVPREIEARHEVNCFVTDDRKGIKSQRSSSVSRKEQYSSRSRNASAGPSRELEVRSSSQSGMSSRGRFRDSLDSPTKASPRLRKERSLSQSRRSASYKLSERTPSRIKCDARDAVSTPRSHHSRHLESRRADLSIESHTLSNPSRDSRLGTASSLVSPRYCEMVTPRSSGRGCNSLVSPQTPRSTGRANSYSFIPSPRSTRSVVFDFTSDSIPRSHDMNVPTPPPPPPPSPSMNPHYQGYLAKENMELRVKLANYEIMEAENTQLRAKLAKMQDVQFELNRIVEVFEGLTRKY
ncbi:hypothetical protein ACHAXA_006613 [Cyclostephanos tholiformis]|uniref:Uncharacterized protein n=1 Tax=Cyclostephanos tholiformis TaxID=382380 RepID=A0ABD3RYR2_9STRA